MQPIIEKLILILLPVFVTALLGSIIARKYKENERFKAVKVTFLPLIEILERKKFPDSTGDTQVFSRMFSAQDSAILKIKASLSDSRRAILNQKWNEYKEKREPYKNRSIQAYIGFVEQHGSDEMRKLIHEMLQIVKKS